MLIFITQPSWASASTQDLFEFNVDLFERFNHSFYQVGNKLVLASDETGVYLVNQALNKLVKFHPKTGETLWEYDAGIAIVAGVSIDETYAYVVAHKRDLVVINKQTGELAARIELVGIPSDNLHNIRASPLVTEKYVVVWVYNRMCLVDGASLVYLGCGDALKPFPGDYRHIEMPSGGVVGKASRLSKGSIVSYNLDNLLSGEDIYNWRSYRFGSNIGSMAVNLDSGGNIHFLTRAKGQVTEPDTIFLYRLTPGSADLKLLTGLRMSAVSGGGAELVVDGVNDIAYTVLFQRDYLEDGHIDYGRLYAIDLGAEDNNVIYEYDFPVGAYVGSRLFLHEDQVYVSVERSLYVFNNNGLKYVADIGYRLKGYADISADGEGNYVFYSLTLPEDNGEAPRLVGIRLSKVKDCPTDRYCTGSPKFRPVVLIHGWGGRNTDWDLGGNKYHYREALRNLFKSKDSDYPEEWIVSYHYGFDSKGVYNYQGKIEEISKNMNEVVPFLSEQHKFYGGDGKVDIIGYSLGGIVAREYLRANADNTRVRKLVTIGSPHQGARILDFDFGAQVCGFIQCYGPEYVMRPMADAIVSQYSENSPDMSVKSPAMRQITPSDSMFYLPNINSKFVNIDATAIYGDIRLRLQTSFFGMNIEKEMSIGDGLIFADSAGDIPNVSKLDSIGYSEDISLSSELVRLPGDFYYGVDMPNITSYKYTHLELQKQPEVLQRVIQLINNE